MEAPAVIANIMLNKKDVLLKREAFYLTSELQAAKRRLIKARCAQGKQAAAISFISADIKEVFAVVASDPFRVL